MNRNDPGRSAWHSDQGSFLIVYLFLGIAKETKKAFDLCVLCLCYIAPKYDIINETFGYGHTNRKETEAMSYLDPRHSKADIRVMSSNILFDKTLPDRLPLIAEYYRNSDADLIGMQEVNKVGTGLFDILADLYAPVALRHPEDKHCFTPILYRKDRYDLVESGSELYRMRGTDTKSMAWAVLCDKSDGQKIALINSHGSLILKAYNLEATDAVEGEMWRVDNVCQMLEKKDALREKYGASLPVFITGDFNSHMDRESIQNMKKVLPDSADVATVSASTGINSFHRVPGRPCDEGTPIDFIFVTDDAIQVLTHHIPCDQTALDISDHCPVYVDAKLK